MANDRTVLIIDDEQDARRIVLKYVERYFPQLTVVGEAGSVEEGVVMIESLSPMIVFLDIQLGDGTGFDVLDRIHRTDSRIIFTTAFDDYAVKAFRYHALDYLLKPIDPEEFSIAVQHVMDMTVTEQSSNLQNWMAQYGNSDRKLGVPTADGVRFIQLDTIVYMEADSSYCKIYLRDNRSVVVSKPLKYFSDKLEGERVFLRPHKSFIVNMNYLLEYVKEDGGMLKLNNGALIPISRQKKDEVIREMNEFFI